MSEESPPQLAGAPDDPPDQTPVPPMPAKSDLASALHQIFVGPKGIRAGWSILIFFCAMLVTVVPVGILLAVVHIPVSANVMTPKTAIWGEFLSVMLVVGPTVVMAVIERKSILSYGFADRRAIPRVLGGFAVGFLAITALICLLSAFGLIAFDRIALHGLSIVGYGLIWTFAFLLLALFEESLFRGYLQHTLARGISFWWAGFILSAVFGLAHLGNSGESWFGVFQVAVAGLLFVLSLRLTGSLYWAVGLHAGWDWAQSYFYGVADSGVMAQGHLLAMHPIGAKFWNGGADGPEGSPLSLLVEAGIAIGIWLYWGRRKDREEAPESPLV